MIASFITPLESRRALVREIIGHERVSMIFADAPLEVCRQRDVKGLYARAQARQVPQMTGIGSTFEAPSRVELTLPTAAVAPDVSARKLLDYAMTRFGHPE